MNSTDRIINTFEHEEPDRVPIYGDVMDSIEVAKRFDGPNLIGEGVANLLSSLSSFDDWINTATALYRKVNLIDRSIMIKTYKFFERLGADIYLFPSNLPLFIKILDKKTVVTDFGAIMKVNKLSEGFETLYYEGGYWKSKEDYESFERLSIDDPKIDQMLNSYLKIRKKVDNIIMAPTFGETFGRIFQGFGMEIFTRLLYQQRSFIEKVFEDLSKFIYEKVKRFLELDPRPPVLCFADDLGEKLGPMLPPRLLRKYVFPWHKRICNMVHKAGSKIYLHCCGNIREIITDFISSGFDGINPIQSTVPQDIFEIHNKFGDKITLMGNVPMPLLTGGTVEQVREYTLRLIKEVGPGGGLIMASDHSIPPNTIPENYIEGMIETTKKYGLYPINL